MKQLCLAAVVALVFGCGGSSTPAAVAAGRPPAAQSESEADFQRRAEQFYWAHLDFRPHAAIQLGYHQHDGKVPDRSPATIAAEIERLRAARTWLDAVDTSRLSRQAQIDREVLLAEVRRELFDLVELDRPKRDPVYYLLFDFSLAPYVDRDYAPLQERAAGLLAACQAAPGYYKQMRANLSASLARPAIEVGMMMTVGASELVGTQVRQHMAALPAGQLRDDIDQCLTNLVSALGELRGDLAGRMAHASDSFALGEQRFVRMLAETQGIEVDRATLEAIGRADLARNRAAIEAAARAIDRNREPRAVIFEAAQDKPDPAKVLEEAAAQVAAMRAFIGERDLVSVPSDDAAEVRASPPYRRGNMASLSSAGPFEREPLPSYYYISPPDPSWPAAEQKAYVPARADLLFLSIHEVWPGHFLQGRHIKAYGSRIMQSFETYSTSEGWAHYAEEMMWEAGVGDGDPATHIGQLKNALLRNVRFLVAIGLHAGGMTLDQAVTMFQEQAFSDPGTARQQAMRGTLDPMYLSYTLGKLAIRKLRDDWQAAQGAAYRLKSFHDSFLRYGEAPLPVIRQMMLGPDCGPVL
jgi:uncharacterized protein (DUF885 family)